MMMVIIIVKHREQHATAIDGIKNEMKTRWKSITDFKCINTHNIQWLCFFFFSSFSLKFFGDDGSVSTPQPYAFHSLTSTHRVLLLLLVFVCCVWVPSARFLCTHFLASISCALSAMPSYTFPCDRCRRRRVHCGRRRHRAKTRSNTMYT